MINSNVFVTLFLDIAIESQSAPIVRALWHRVDYHASAEYSNMYIYRAIAAANVPYLEDLFDETIGTTQATLRMLWEAAKTGSAELFTYLRYAKGFLDLTNEYTADGWIIAASIGGSLAIFDQVFYAMGGGNIEIRLDSGESLLHLACRAGSVELATHFIDNKLNINDENNHCKESPICLAVRSGSLPLVKYLFHAGADVAIILSEHSSTFPCASLLHLAASCNSHEILAWLLTGECLTHFDLELRDGAGWMPIHHAAQTGKVDCLRILQEYGADINARISIKNFVTLEGGNTPLMIASFLAAEESVVFLLEHGAEVNHQCAQGYSALYFAIPQQNQHIYPQDSFAAERYERATRIIKLLLSKEELQPNLRISDTRFDTRPLDQALWLQHVGIAQLLIEDSRVDVNGCCCKTGLPFAYAIAHYMEDIATLLLKRNDLDVNQANSSGESPLVCAQAQGLMELCSLIQGHPGFAGGENPVFALVRENKLTEVQTFLERDPDLIELTHDNGETLLYIACSSSAVDMIKLIVSFWQARVSHWLDGAEYDLIQAKITARWHVSFGAMVHQVAFSLAQAEAAFVVAARDGADAVQGLLTQYLETFPQVFPEREEHCKLAAAQLSALACIALLKSNVSENVDADHRHLRNTLEMLYFNQKNNNGNFPLWEVAVRDVNAKCVACVEYLLNLENVLVNLECSSGDAPVLVFLPAGATTPWGEKVLKLFLNSPRVDVNKHSRRNEWDGHSALTKALETAATFERALTIVKLRPDVDINYRVVDPFGGRSAMAYAAGANCLELMKLMLAFPSVNVNVVDANGLTPLIYAAMNHRHMVMEILIADQRVDVDAAIMNRSQDLYPAGCTALHCAAHGNEVRCLELLYQRSTLIREPRTTIEQWTPLMFAALKGFSESVKWLVAQGADVLAVDKDGMTARLLALQCGRIRIAGILLEKEQELEMIVSQMHQDELTANINAIEAQQKEFERAQEEFFRAITLSIEDLKATVLQHTEQLVVLYREREVMLSERLIVQQLAAAVKFIMDRPLLKAFYNHLQSKLTELFLAYKSLASGALSRAETTTDTMVGYAINLAGGMIPYVGDVATMVAEIAYGTVRDGREDAIFACVSSIVVNMDEMTQLVKAAARLTLYKLEYQLEKLDGKGEAESLAECVVGYYLAGLRSKAIELKENASVYEQLSLCLFKYEPAGMFAYLNETVLKTHPSYDLPKWTARGSLKESGIATSDGVCLAHPKASVKTYGYRFGSVEEAVQLGYVESSTRVDPAHPLRENPYRHKEVVEMPEVPPVLTWPQLLANAKDFPDLTGCIDCLDTCEDDGLDVKIIFKPEVTRPQLLQLVGYLSKQSKQVLDRSIGPVLSCKAAKGSTTIVMTTDSEASAELLSMLILNHWQP